jgi:hypothetical protein
LSNPQIFWMGKNDVDALQTKVNENGGVGIICAKDSF